MKIATLLLALFAGLMINGAAVYAQDGAPEAAPAHKAGKKKAGKKKGKAEKADKTAKEDKAEKAEKPGKGDASPMAKALKKVNFVTSKKADPKATHYIYLISASWCGPCNAEMPHVVEQYKEMSKCGVELILVSADHDKSQAVGFMKKYGANFPGTMGDTERHKLLGWENRSGIPYAIIVDADGNRLTIGNAASVISGWRQTTGK